MANPILNPYDFPLKKIQGIAFTKREIDVVACLTSGRTLKGISNFLNIHYKTLEVHMANIRQKLGVSVRDYIIETLENLPEYALLKSRYHQFQQLKTLQETLQKIDLEDAIIYYTPDAKKFALSLQKHLAPFALKVCLWNPEKSPTTSLLLTTNENHGGILLSSDPTAENSFYYSVLKALAPTLSLKPPLLSSSPTTYKKPKIQKKWLWMILFMIGGFFLYTMSPPPSSSFLERPAIQKSINALFKKATTTTNPLVVLVGTGGIGKTTAARFFLETHRFHFEINAETPTTLINSYFSLGTHLAEKFNLKAEYDEILSIQNPASKEEQLLSFIQGTLKKTTWVFLYDNVENWKDVIPYLPLDPKKWGKGKILVTSRNQVVLAPATHIIEIPTLKDSEKQNLFLKFYDKGHQKKGTAAFLKNIPPFPLDILLAASYLNAIDISYDDYLKRLHLSSDDFNELQSSLHYQGRGTRHQIIIQAIKSITKNSPSNTELFLLCCLLDADHIPLEALEIHSPHADDFIYHMKKHSLLKASNEGFFFIHRSTQHHGLIYFSNYPLESTLIKFMDTLEKTYEAYCPKDKSHSLNLLRHLESFQEKIKDLSVPKSLEEKILIRINLLRASIYDRALSNVQKVKEILSKTLTLDQEAQLLSPSQKRELFMDLGRMKGLSGHFYDAIQCYKKALTLSSPDYRAKCLIAIGFEYVWLNDFKEAKAHLEKGIMDAEKQFSPNKSQLMADGYAFLATLYSTTFLEKREATALSYLEKAEEIVKQTPNYERALLRLYRNRAQVYCRGLHYQESLDLCIKPAREILKKLTGPDHNLLRLSLDACEGEIFLRQGKIIEARDLLEKTVHKYFQLLGKDDAFMILYPLVHYIESLVRNKEFKKAEAYITLATTMKNPAYTNFHKFLYKQLEIYKHEATRATEA